MLSVSLFFKQKKKSLKVQLHSLSAFFIKILYTDIITATLK